MLVYVRPDCRPCEGIFRALGEDRFRGHSPQRGGLERRESEAQSAAAPDAGGRRARKGRGAYLANVQDATQKLVIVVGGATPEEVSRMAASMPWIPQGSWYADPKRQVAARMGWQAAPVIAGFKRDSVMWSHTGLPRGMSLRSLMSTWHEQQEGATPRPAGARTK